LFAAAQTEGTNSVSGEVVELLPYTVQGTRAAPEILPLRPVAGAAALPSGFCSALPALPGLIWQEGGDAIYPARITARGSGLQSAPVSRGLMLQMDGLPLNAADGSFNLALLEPSLLGGCSFAAGAADPAATGTALGGTIDLLRWHQPSDTAATSSVAFGGNGYVHAAVLGANEGVAYTHTDGYRPNAQQNRVAGSARLRWGRGAGPEQLLGIYVARAQYEVPGPLTLAVAQRDRSAISSLAAIDLPRRNTDLVRGVYQVRWPVGIESSLGLQYIDDYFRQLRANGVAVTRGADLLGRISGTWTIGAVKLGTGVGGSYGERAQDRFINKTGKRGAQFADIELHAANGTAWVDADWQPVPQLDVRGGICATANRREADGTSTAKGTTSGRGLAPNAEIGWKPIPAKSPELFVRFERGAEAPTFDNLLAVAGSPTTLKLRWTQLQFQTSDTFSTGVRGRLRDAMDRDWISFGCTLYSAEWRNELLALADANGAPRGTVNAGPTRHRGVETTVRWRLLRGSQSLELTASHVASEARFKHDPVYGNNRLAGLPPQVATVRLDFAQDKGLFAGVGGRWVGGATYADHKDTASYGGTLLADASLGWRWRRWTLGLSVSNVFDRHYIASTAGVLAVAPAPAATAVYLPGGPRTFTASCEWRW
jgi:iron complex outermembrane receptor protein